jgi:hypothetical protein
MHCTGCKAGWYDPSVPLAHLYTISSPGPPGPPACRSTPHRVHRHTRDSSSVSADALATVGGSFKLLAAARVYVIQSGCESEQRSASCDKPLVDTRTCHSRVYRSPPHNPGRSQSIYTRSTNCPTTASRKHSTNADTAMEKLRIVTLRFGTARQRMVLERWTNSKPQRSARSIRYEVPPCRGGSAGVA